MSKSSFEFYQAQQAEPSLTVINETRALRHSRHELTIDEAREAYYRQTQDWQWQEEMARKADERIEKQENYSI